MKILLPQNIFSGLIADSLPPEIKGNISFYSSSLITSELIKSGKAVGLIPTMDIIKHNELFISKDFGLSFEGSLCNSYFYFNDSRRQLKEIALSGDVSSVEVVLCKILFREMYDTEIEVKILTDASASKGHNLLLVGDDNFVQQKYQQAISFAEEVIETLSLPFVNYTFAGLNKSSLEQMNGLLKDKSTLIYSNVDNDKFGDNLPAELKAYIKENISSFVIDFDGQDVESINQTIRLPYFYGMVKDIVEVNFV